MLALKYQLSEIHLELVLQQAAHSISTVAVYQVDGTVISFGIFPTCGYGDSAANPPTTTDAAKFLAAANITYTGFQLDSCTSIGLKLAAS
jgi:hypothetical protein